MPGAVLEAPVSVELTHKFLVTGELWDRLVDRIMHEEELDRSLAERIMNEALGFLRLVAQDPSQAYAPSSLVDIGWHTLVLYTREYAALCHRVAGRFIHHEPDDELDHQTGGCVRTVQALRAAGFPVDDQLWETSADCGGKSCFNADCRAG
ncbi:MAG: hypothetical protein L0Y54_17260 [Sporichthyaceae bacterium]|nr:hypothetical protein [Sporichthyaceae bacterium]